MTTTRISTQQSTRRRRESTMKTIRDDSFRCRQFVGTTVAYVDGTCRRSDVVVWRNHSCLWRRYHSCWCRRLYVVGWWWQYDGRGWTRTNHRYRGGDCFVLQDSTMVQLDRMLIMVMEVWVVDWCSSWTTCLRRVRWSVQQRLNQGQLTNRILQIKHTVDQMTSAFVISSRNAEDNNNNNVAHNLSGKCKCMPRTLTDPMVKEPNMD